MLSRARQSAAGAPRGAPRRRLPGAAGAWLLAVGACRQLRARGRVPAAGAACAGPPAAVGRREPCDPPPCGYWEAEYEAKKSRFVARLARIATFKEAREFRLRVGDFTCSHNCWAAVNRRGESLGSDDGEPGGTAGKPMRALLMGGNFIGVVVVVTRYYGGTKLGTGGLVRAYSAACRGAIAAAEWKEVVAASQLFVSGLPAAQVNALYRLVEAPCHQGEMLSDVLFDERGTASATVWVPRAAASALRGAILRLGGEGLAAVEAPEDAACRPAVGDRVRIRRDSEHHGFAGVVVQEDLGSDFEYKIRLDMGTTRWFAGGSVEIIDAEQPDGEDVGPAEGAGPDGGAGAGNAGAGPADGASDVGWDEEEWAALLAEESQQADEADMADLADMADEIKAAAPPTGRSPAAEVPAAEAPVAAAAPAAAPTPSLTAATAAAAAPAAAAPAAAEPAAAPAPGGRGAGAGLRGRLSRPPRPA